MVHTIEKKDRWILLGPHLGVGEVWTERCF